MHDALKATKQKISPTPTQRGPHISSRPAVHPNTFNHMGVMVSKNNVKVTGIPLRKVFRSLHPMQIDLGLRALGMHSTASPTRIEGCTLVKPLIPLRPHQE